ncbi:MAG: MRP family ATP-binding protein [bacterium TMED46]|nr:MAG: MRP family ATP-binding protein [bacterium TMED46]
MNKEQVLEKLKSINYPGFNRDIVSFGMVKDIVIKDNHVNVKINISSQNEEKKQAVINDVKKELDSHFSSVEIDVTSQAASTPSTPPANAPNVVNNVDHIIAIASGKGGVGKSTVAANIACALAREGKKVGLLDLDIYGPSLPITLGINEQPQMTQENKLIPLEKFGMKIMSFGFISGNDTPVIWRGPLVSRMTEQFFRDVDWGELDILVLDLPPGTGDIQLTLTQKLRMTGAIIVTTPQDIALADVRKGADMFRKVNTPLLGVIENMSGLILSGNTDPDNSKLEINGQKVEPDNNGSFSISLDLFKKGGGEKESERLGVPLLGKVPISESIMSSTDSGTPLTTHESLNDIGKIYVSISKQIVSLIE